MGHQRNETRAVTSITFRSARVRIGLMNHPKFPFLGLFSALIILGFQCAPSLAASIEDVLTSLKGLSAKERLARVESEARKEGRVHWASSTPQAWAEPALANISKALSDDSGRVPKPKRQSARRKSDSRTSRGKIRYRCRWREYRHFRWYERFRCYSALPFPRSWPNTIKHEGSARMVDWLFRRYSSDYL